MWYLIGGIVGLTVGAVVTLVVWMVLRDEKDDKELH